MNFSKRSILGVNVSPLFLSLAEGFLHCKLGVVSFKYLGLPIGANPCRLATWDLSWVFFKEGFSLGRIGLLLLGSDYTLEFGPQ